MAAVEPSDEWRGAPLLRRFSHAILWSISRTFWRVKVSGVERIPATGPVILAANHVSLADGPFMGMASAPRRYMRGLTKIEMFNIPGLGWWLRGTGQLPVDRGGDVSAMRSCIDLLKAGGCLGLMPEGTRSKDGKPGRPKAGVGFLSGLTGAWVVPTHVINTEEFPRLAAMEVRFGEPLKYEGDPADRKACMEFGQKVLDRIFSL